MGLANLEKNGNLFSFPNQNQPKICSSKEARVSDPKDGQASSFACFCWAVTREAQVAEATKAVAESPKFLGGSQQSPWRFFSLVVFSGGFHFLFVYKTPLKVILCFIPPLTAGDLRAAQVWVCHSSVSHLWRARLARGASSAGGSASGSAAGAGGAWGNGSTRALCCKGKPAAVEHSLLSIYVCAIFFFDAFVWGWSFFWHNSGVAPVLARSHTVLPEASSWPIGDHTIHPGLRQRR